MKEALVVHSYIQWLQLRMTGRFSQSSREQREKIYCQNYSQCFYCMLVLAKKVTVGVISLP